MRSISGVLPFVLSVSAPPRAQSIEVPGQSGTWPVRLVIGLPGIPPDTEGTLAVDTTKLRFRTANASAEVDRRFIMDFASGDESVETGGKSGRIVRTLTPYGVGEGLSVITQKKKSLLTVEFLDSRGDYHGAVFVLDAEELDNIMSSLEDQLPRFDSLPVSALPNCPKWKINPHTVRVEPIEVDFHSKLPPEDRVLLYEYLVRQLRAEPTTSSVYRAGDRRPEAECAEFVVIVKAILFKKGDQTVRAHVGPFGHFIGTTRLRYHLTVLTQDKNRVIDKDMKKSEGADTDSLNISKIISKSIAKQLKKTRKELCRSRAGSSAQVRRETPSHASVPAA